MIIGVKERYPLEYCYQKIPVLDVTGEDLSPFFSSPSFDFIEEGRERGGVLVHCMQVRKERGKEGKRERRKEGKKERRKEGKRGKKGKMQKRQKEERKKEGKGERKEDK